MKRNTVFFSGLLATALLCSVTAAFADNEVIEKVMKYAHKAPKGEKKVHEKIIEGTASEAEIDKVLQGYKSIENEKPPKGEQADFTDRVKKVVAALEDVKAKKEGAGPKLKEALNCKACHTEHKPD